MAKNGHVHEGGKVGRSYATPSNFFKVDSYDLKSMSFKFGNDTFITFEMPRVSYRVDLPILSAVNGQKAQDNGLSNVLVISSNSS